jgi:hypothetical protein
VSKFDTTIEKLSQVTYKTDSFFRKLVPLHWQWVSVGFRSNQSRLIASVLVYLWVKMVCYLSTDKFLVLCILTPWLHSLQIWPFPVKWCHVASYISSVLNMHVFCPMIPVFILAHCADFYAWLYLLKSPNMWTKVPVVAVAASTKHAKTGIFVHMLGDFSMYNRAYESQRSVLRWLMESLSKIHAY